MHILVDTTEPAYSGIRALCDTAFKARWPANRFEPTLNVAQTRAIIEVPNDVTAAITANPAVVDFWLDDLHQAKLIEHNFYSPEWQAPEEGL